MVSRSSLPEVFLGKDALKLSGKFTGEHPCRCMISVKLFWILNVGNSHGCLHIEFNSTWF